MKTYVTPDIKSIDFSKESIASLNDWLNSAGGIEYADAGITTYCINS